VCIAFENDASSSVLKSFIFIQATHKNGKVLSFYTMPEYEAWKESLDGRTSGWSIKYYKVFFFCLYVWVIKQPERESKKERLPVLILFTSIGSGYQYC
jgi:hypothetical protein